jgi:hypothetical protein
MPKLDQYEVTVNVGVVVRGAEGVVSEYGVTRRSSGASARTGDTPPAERFSEVVEQAVVAAVAAERALRAGAANSEARRLK